MRIPATTSIAVLFASTLIFATPLLCAAAPYEQTHPTRGESAVPADLAQMALDFNAAILSHDMDRIMSFYSEKYFHDGKNKERHRRYIASWADTVSVFELKFTRFAAISDDHGYIEASIDRGFATGSKDFDYQVIKENGQWKWVGNQRP